MSAISGTQMDYCENETSKAYDNLFSDPSSPKSPTMMQVFLKEMEERHSEAIASLERKIEDLTLKSINQQETIDYLMGIIHNHGQMEESSMIQKTET